MVVCGRERLFRFGQAVTASLGVPVTNSALRRAKLNFTDLDIFVAPRAIIASVADGW
jgi:hypothetical protein